MERKHIDADVGVVIGSFQVDVLHPVHKELLDWVHVQHSKVIIVLGCPSIFGTRNNPLDYEARSLMIQESYPRAIITSVTDCRSDEEWSENLDKTIHSLLLPGQTAVLYGARDSFLPHYFGKIRTQELVGESALFWSGSEIRRRIKNQVRPTADFRAGVIWASMNRYPTCYATVDLAIMRTAPDPEKMVPASAPKGGLEPAPRREVLLARKESDPPGEWRFIGGFSDPVSETFEDDVKREIQEETGLEVDDPKYVGSRKINDWRYRGEQDCIKTLFFKAEYVFGAPSPRAKDDIASVAWFPLDELTELNIVGEHRGLFLMLLGMR